MVSVIIPVYNAEKYIRKCVSSVLRQSYSDLEVILVNDGSKDSSSEILHEISEEDQRVVAIDQENTGASGARNSGLDAATGDYIVFVDSDDLIPEKYILRLLFLIIRCCWHNLTLLKCWILNAFLRIIHP